MDAGIIIAVGAAIVIIFLTLFGRRIRTHYGTLRPSSQVTTHFEEYRENPALTYYTSGPDTYPTAIMGLEPSVELDTKLWKRQNLRQDTFKTLIQAMQEKASHLGLQLQGFTMISKTGERIGEWYSVLGLHIVIQTTRSGRVSITPPPHHIYTRHDEE
jgi:hypothetical protein